MRVLRVARSSARKGRTQALNQMRGLISTAPDPIRAELRGLSVFQLLERASTYRPGAKRDIISLTKFTLRMSARRAITLEEEISEIDAILKPLVKETTPELVATLGIGTDAASALLVAAGDNPGRLRNEAASPTSAALRHSMPAAARTSDTDSIAAAIVRPTLPSGTSCSPAWSTTLEPPSTSIDAREADQEGGGALPQALRRSRGVRPPPHENWGLTAHRSIELGAPWGGIIRRTHIALCQGL